ncbi:hypothetical protein TPAR_00321 [Tolypocladium paradoxum]|uniref:Uncharacterized protein n=1 Tax=Tolypocladium paradoxum TaxID=94208 RepID=A0A2S4LAI8_9HYPO|nr:hypothetical protein TPAR_00321 [Tolypocladium paradoxum]
MTGLGHGPTVLRSAKVSVSLCTSFGLEAHSRCCSPVLPLAAHQVALFSGRDCQQTVAIDLDTAQTDVEASTYMSELVMDQAGRRRGALVPVVLESACGPPGRPEPQAAGDMVV